MKNIPKANISFDFYHLTSSTVLDRKANTTYINIKTTHPISLTFFSNFLSFDSRVFFFFVFCISSNKLNRISCGIFLSFRSKHSELFCKIIIQLSSSGIFLGLWSKGPPCMQLYRSIFLAQLWMTASNHLIKACVRYFLKIHYTSDLIT